MHTNIQSLLHSIANCQTCFREIPSLYTSPATAFAVAAMPLLSHCGTIHPLPKGQGDAGAYGL